tara:strand:+ start:652 stop:807 length:156 start_codon:yes stop_codon:yes gene_type:complete
MWEAVWRHGVTGVLYKEYSYDLSDLKRELQRVEKYNGNKVVNGPYPKMDAE